MSDAPHPLHSVFVSGPSAPLRCRSCHDVSAEGAVASSPPAHDTSADAIGASSLVLASTLLADLRAHHPETAAHSVRVARLTMRVAPHLPGEPYRGRMAEVYAAAALHDIGKLRIPAAVLAAPRRLSPPEWAVVARHPAHGARLLRRHRAARAVGSLLLAEAAGGHHEWWDGDARGYPRRLQGEEIPAIARLVALCDAYDAMTSDRPYRRGLPPAAAFLELERGAGTQFEPALVAQVLAAGLLRDAAA